MISDLKGLAPVHLGTITGDDIFVTAAFADSLSTAIA